MGGPPPEGLAYKQTRHLEVYDNINVDDEDSTEPAENPFQVGHIYRWIVYKGVILFTHFDIKIYNLLTFTTSCFNPTS